MVDQQRIIRAIYLAVDGHNEATPRSRQLEKSLDTVLYGSEARLDSLGLVSLIVAVEDRVQEDLDISIIIADERAMSLSSSPFRTIGTLADYVGEMLKGSGPE